MAKKTEIQDTTRIDALFERISALIEQGRRHVVTAANIAEVYTKYGVGRYIVEDEQEGNYRAQYGKQVLKTISFRLTERFGKGWSVDTLEKCRTFYYVYNISATPSRNFMELSDEKTTKQSAGIISATVLRKLEKEISFSLSWSHYLILMRIENAEARSFYEIECAQQQWSVRQLSRQVGSSLYERLALSRDKDEVMHCPRMPISMLHNTNSTCPTKLCFKQR